MPRPVFIQTYHSFPSTFVIGAAGLVATSIWQYKQSEIAKHQAESQQRIATTQAENIRGIERAEILSKNLQVLASSGGNTVEQRYGVLLSLTRGNIMDPELTVSEPVAQQTRQRGATLRWGWRQGAVVLQQPHQFERRHLFGTHDFDVAGSDRRQHQPRIAIDSGIVLLAQAEHEVIHGAVAACAVLVAFARTWRSVVV
jgi:hypothetical protein